MSKGFYGFATFFECGFDLTNPLLSAVLPSSLMVFLMHTGISALTKEGKTDFSTVLERKCWKEGRDLMCTVIPTQEDA